MHNAYAPLYNLGVERYFLVLKSRAPIPRGNHDGTALAVKRAVAVGAARVVVIVVIANDLCIECSVEYSVSPLILLRDPRRMRCAMAVQPPYFGGRKDLVDKMANHQPLTGEAAKISEWKAQEHPIREQVSTWVLRGFFILLGLALLAFLIAFPIFFFR